MASWWPFGDDEIEEPSAYATLTQEEFNQAVMKYNRHEMLRSSLFGETPLLQIEKSQPLIMTHEMLKRSVENLGFSSESNEGPFLVLSDSGHRIRSDGWEQLGGYINGHRYGMWVSPQKLRMIKMWIWITIILAIPTFGVTLLVSIGLAIWLAMIESAMNKSKIEATVIYSGFRKVRTTRQKLGEPMLESILDTISKHKLDPVSSFLGGISQFEGQDGKPGPVKMTISYSMHTKQESVRPIIEADFRRLGSSLLESLVVSAEEYSATPKPP
ncbi:MAG: hypothetical protein QGG96_05925, partial [Candidatus Poseidoniaceae archaeon]|nr:hypothetical protein [Candidatus Poseidoniaceae archaeon]